MQRKETSIQNLWETSDKRNLEILKNPLKDPLHYLNLVLFYGMTQRDFQRRKTTADGITELRGNLAQKQ